jgi:hypothetical protein
MVSEHCVGGWKDAFKNLPRPLKPETTFDRGGGLPVQKLLRAWVRRPSNTFTLVLESYLVCYLGQLYKHNIANFGVKGNKSNYDGPIF